MLKLLIHLQFLFLAYQTLPYNYTKLQVTVACEKDEFGNCKRYLRPRFNYFGQYFEGGTCYLAKDYIPDKDMLSFQVPLKPLKFGQQFSLHFPGAETKITIYDKRTFDGQYKVWANINKEEYDVNLAEQINDDDKIQVTIDLEKFEMPFIFTYNYDFGFNEKYDTHCYVEDQSIKQEDGSVMPGYRLFLFIEDRRYHLL